MENKIKIFENKQVRTLWSADEEEWYFSVVDIVAVLTDSPNPRKYWSVLKTRLKAEGSEVTTNCSQLKMLAPDGKYRMRDAMDTKGVLRLVQSIPSPKAESYCSKVNSLTRSAKTWKWQRKAVLLQKMQEKILKAVYIRR